MSAPPCWLNGVILPAEAVRIDPADRGFTLGDGVFETVAVVGGRAAHLSRHLARLQHGAAALRLNCGWSHAAIGQAVAAVIEGAGQPAGSLRLTLSRGPAARGLLPDRDARETLLITWTDWETIPDSIEAIICGNTRRNEASPLSRIKSLNYLDAVLARMEAADNGAEDAVLLNTSGAVAEASSANLFIWRDGQLRTPPLQDGALPGITRALLIERAGAAEASLTPADLQAADAVILTNSLGLRQIVRLNETCYAPAPDLLAQWRTLIKAPDPWSG